MSITEAEIATQPDLWRRAAGLAAEVAGVLPARGEDVCVVGCGTSLYMAQAWAALREAAGHGRTDAVAASELPDTRRYDVLVAISRSGTTTEVVGALRRAPAGRTVALTAVAGSPVARAATERVLLDFADERSVVQTRFATTVLALLRAHVDGGARGAAERAATPGGGGATASDAGEDAARDAETALAAELPVAPAGVEQWTFLGRGWTVGLAGEAALKLREAAGAWTEAYPAFEYRHGPISVTGPRSVVWSFGPFDPALAGDARAAGARVVDPPLDPLAGLVLAQRVAVALAAARGLDPDRPRNLTRSIVLADDPLEGRS